MGPSTVPTEPQSNEGLPPQIQDLIGRRLDALFPIVEDVDLDTRLGQVLLRLKAALIDAQAERQVSKIFSDALIAAVPRLRRFALMRTGSAAAADDLVQATLLKAWEHRSRFQAGTNLGAWLFTILRNAHINQGKRHRREVQDIDGIFAAALSVPAQQEDRIGLVALQAALDDLPTEQRETLLLVVLEDLPYEAAALVLGCQPGTVKSRVSRARERLSLALRVA